jgi:hypothetical protein
MKKFKMNRTMIENIFGAGGSDTLNNAGGPGSRIRSEKITSSFAEILNLAEERTGLALMIPPEIFDVEEWLINEMENLGWTSSEEAAGDLLLPGEKMLVHQSIGAPANSGLTGRSLVRTALILARCNESFYVPGSPLIFTRKRLNRSIDLIKINIKSYYELE